MKNTLTNTDQFIQHEMLLCPSYCKTNTVNNNVTLRPTRGTGPPVCLHLSNWILSESALASLLDDRAVTQLPDVAAFRVLAHVNWPSARNQSPSAQGKQFLSSSFFLSSWSAGVTFTAFFSIVRLSRGISGARERLRERQVTERNKHCLILNTADMAESHIHTAFRS